MQYLEAHFCLEIHATLEDLLQVSQPHAVSSNQPSFYKLLTYILTSDLDISPYSEQHELLHMIESQTDTFTGKIIKDEDGEDLHMTLPEKCISSDRFKVMPSIKVY